MLLDLIQISYLRPNSNIRLTFSVKLQYFPSSASLRERLRDLLKKAECILTRHWFTKQSIAKLVLRDRFIKDCWSFMSTPSFWKKVCVTKWKRAICGRICPVLLWVGTSDQVYVKEISELLLLCQFNTNLHTWDIYRLAQSAGLSWRLIVNSVHRILALHSHVSPCVRHQAWHFFSIFRL